MNSSNDLTKLKLTSGPEVLAQFWFQNHSDDQMQVGRCHCLMQLLRLHQTEQWGEIKTKQGPMSSVGEIGRTEIGEPKQRIPNRTPRLSQSLGPNLASPKPRRHSNEYENKTKTKLDRRTFPPHQANTKREHSKTISLDAETQSSFSI